VGLFEEQVKYMGTFTRKQRNPYSNTYYSGWAQHPNLSWRRNNSLNTPNKINPQPPKNSLEEMLVRYMQTRPNQIQRLFRNQLEAQKK